MEHQYHHLEDIFPEAHLAPFAFPEQADWPSSFPPPPLPHASTTRNYSTAPGRQGSETNAPTRGQASRRPDQGPYVCGEEKANGETCEQTFGLQKDLNRHLKTLHAAKDAKRFVCCCGKSGIRFDNHQRHVKSCRAAGGTFICKQGHRHVSKKEYLRHLKDGCR